MNCEGGGGEGRESGVRAILRDGRTPETGRPYTSLVYVFCSHVVPSLGDARTWQITRSVHLALLSCCAVAVVSYPVLSTFGRQAEMGSRLTELSVCDLALRHLVRPTELTELAEVWSMP